MLLRIGEHFGLRGPEIDKLNLAALDKEREKAVKDALGDLKKMTLTVIDGDFPREVVGAQNLIFGEYRMPARRNSAEFYDAKDKKPAGKREGTLKLGMLELPAQRGNAFRFGLITLGAMVSVGLVAVGLRAATQDIANQLPPAPHAASIGDAARHGENAEPLIADDHLQTGSLAFVSPDGTRWLNYCVVPVNLAAGTDRAGVAIDQTMAARRG